MDGFEDEPTGGASIAAPLIRALLAAAIAFGVYWLVFAADTEDPVPEIVATVSPAPGVPEEPVVTPTTPPPVIASTPTPAPTEVPALAQPGIGQSAQILNGTDDQALYDSVLQTLIDYGYDVTESGRAANDYAQTTIFATAGSEDAATALQTADPRFTTIGDNPGLNAQLNIHIIVGADWVVTPE